MELSGLYSIRFGGNRFSPLESIIFILYDILVCMIHPPLFMVNTMDHYFQLKAKFNQFSPSILQEINVVIDFIDI